MSKRLAVFCICSLVLGAIGDGSAASTLKMMCSGTQAWPLSALPSYGGISVYHGKIHWVIRQ
jgi:hypothetical protein